MSKTKKLMRTPGLFFSDMVRKKVGLPTSGQMTVNSTASMPLVAVAANKAVIPKGSVAVVAAKAVAPKPLKLAHKTLQGYMTELTVFAVNYNVNTIKIGEEHLWPYLRSHLVSQYIALYGKKNPPAARMLYPPRVTMGSDKDLPFSLREAYVEKYGALEVEDLPECENLDFLFFTFTNATEQVEINGKYFYRVTDTVFECAETIGTAKKIEIIRSNSMGLRKIPRYYHRPILCMAPYVHTYGHHKRLTYDRDLFTSAERYLPSISISFELLAQTVDWEISTREYYLRVFKKLRPKVVFVPAFHMCPPLISAARELGILTVDIQHGIQVGWNPLYNDWNEAPSNGYRALPDYFMVWSSKEFENIRSVFPWSEPLMIGHTWLARQLRVGEQLSSGLRNSLNKRNVNILVALQLHVEVPEWLVTLVRSLPDECNLLVRNHPKALRKFKASDFYEFNSGAAIICGPELDAAPLAPLLSEVGSVISEGSSVSAEAELFGCCIFLVGDIARSNYGAEVASGKYFVFEDADKFYEKVTCLVENDDGQRRDEVMRALDYTKASLLKLLEKSSEKVAGK